MLQRRRLDRRRLLVVLAVVSFVAAVLVLGPYGLIPVGLLLAFSTEAEEEADRSISLTPRNLGLAAAMMAAAAWFWLGYPDLTASTLVMIAGVLLALPLALQEFHRRRRLVIARSRLPSAVSSWPFGDW